MPLGITQSALDPDRLAGSFKMASEAGAEGIELICATDEQARSLLSEEGTKEISKLKKNFGLEVPSIALPVLTKTESLFGKPAVVSSAEKLIGQAMTAAGRIGATVVLLPFLGKAMIELEEELDRVIDALHNLAEEAEESGLTLGIESTLNVDQQLHLLTHMGAYNSVKAYFDTGTTLARKLDPVTSLRDLGREHICQIHFRDVRLGEEGKPPDWNVALGEGDVDFPAIANAIAAMSLEDWIILETPATDDPLAAAKANLKFAREILAPR